MPSYRRTGHPVTLVIHCFIFCPSVYSGLPLRLLRSAPPSTPVCPSVYSGLPLSLLRSPPHLIRRQGSALLSRVRRAYSFQQTGGQAPGAARPAPTPQHKHQRTPLTLRPPLVAARPADPQTQKCCHSSSPAWIRHYNPHIKLWQSDRDPGQQAHSGPHQGTLQGETAYHYELQPLLPELLQLPRQPAQYPGAAGRRQKALSIYSIRPMLPSSPARLWQW